MLLVLSYTIFTNRRHAEKNKNKKKKQQKKKTGTFSHESEALLAKLAQCLVQIPPKMALCGLLFK